MKLAVLLFIVSVSWSITSCGESTSEEGTKEAQGDNSSKENISEEDQIEMEIDYGTNAPSGGEIMMDNDKYLITSTPLKSAGEMIVVQYKNSSKTFFIDDFASYYKELVGDLLIVDNGTSNSRTCQIFDLTIGKKVAEFGYEEMTIVEDKINFLQQIQDDELKVKPVCSDEFNDMGSQLGYVERQMMDLKTLQITKTGQYECWIFE